MAKPKCNMAKPSDNMENLSIKNTFFRKIIYKTPFFSKNLYRRAKIKLKKRIYYFSQQIIFYY